MSKKEDLPVSYKRFASQWNHPTPKGLTFGPSMTEQSHREDSDINVLLSRYKKTGELPLAKTGMYADFADPLDFQEAQNTVVHAMSQFEALPAKIRDRFNNDPKKFLEFTSDASNAEEMVALGIAVKRPPEAKGAASNDAIIEPPKEKSHKKAAAKKEELGE